MNILNQINNGSLGVLTPTNFQRFKTLAATDDDEEFKVVLQTLLSEHEKEMKIVEDRTDKIRNEFYGI